jgi:hypothetical protein
VQNRCGRAARGQGSLRTIGLEKAPAFSEPIGPELPVDTDFDGKELADPTRSLCRHWRACCLGYFVELRPVCFQQVAEPAC